MNKPKTPSVSFGTRIKEPINEMLEDYVTRTGISRNRVVEMALFDFLTKTANKISNR